MLHGDVLHPLHVGHIVDVRVLINGVGRNDDDFGVAGGNGHAAIIRRGGRLTKKDLLLGKQVSDLICQIADMEGFAQKPVRPGPDGDHAAIGIIERRNDDNGRLTEIRVLPEHATQLKPSRFRHHQVQQDHIGLFLNRHFHGFAAVVHCDRLVRARQQNCLQEIGRTFVIIYNEDLCHNVY